MLKSHNVLWRVQDSDIPLLTSNSCEVFAGVREISSFAFRDCKNLKHLTIPETVHKIAYDAFAGTNIESITFKAPVDIHSSNLDNYNLNYIIKTDNPRSIVLTKNKPEDKKVNAINIKKAKLVIKDFDISLLLKLEGFNDFKKLIKKLYSRSFFLTNDFVENLALNNQLKDFAENAEFTFIKNEVLNFKKLLNIENLTSKNLLHFANSIGCFSNQKLLNKEGKETDTILAQKASSFFADILDKNILKISDFNKRLNFLYGSKVNMDFFKFISQGKSENYPNLKTLIMLDDKYPGIFDKMLKTFSFKDIKRTTEQNKKNKKMSWQEALTAAYLVKKYANITEETKGLAKLFAKHNLSQEIFDQAVEIHSKAKGVKPHILSKPLKEETILESIEKIKEKTGKSLINAQKQIEELYEKEFTYEMLNKHDTINYIIGLYTNCCATIYSIFNGSSIAKATILSDNVQNIVIRDSEGEIAAKGALYINQAMRYGVINSLIVNEKYREFKKSLGVECNQISQHADKKRELIYNAFIRGVNNFVTAYNLEHPMAPLKKIAVGLNNNSLYSQCSKLKKENKILNVPDMYGFSDAIEQRIIYKKEKKSIFSKPQTEQEM